MKTALGQQPILVQARVPKTSRRPLDGLSAPLETKLTLDSRPEPSETGPNPTLRLDAALFNFNEGVGPCSKDLSFSLLPCTLS